MMKIHRSNYFLDEEKEVVVRKKRGTHKFLKILLTILIVLVVLVSFVLLFHTRKITITGNKYCTRDEVQAWIQKDPLSYNTLYTWWKYNYTNAKELPMIETMEISMISPWEIDVRVYEKSIVGYLDFDGMRVYFDKEGVVLFKTTDDIEGVPLIDGISVDLKKVVLHEKLPQGDSKDFERIFEASIAAVQNGIEADKISIDSLGAVSIHIGKVTAALGTSDYEDKIAQIPPIMKKLKKKYPKKKGTLHLENYSKEHSNINFTPE